MRSIPMVSNFISLLKIDPITCLASTLSPTATVIGMTSPFLVLAPGPTANTSPSLFFDTALSGMKIPPAVFKLGITRLISTRSASGMSFFRADICGSEEILEGVLHRRLAPGELWARPKVKGRSALPLLARLAGSPRQQLA